MGMAPEQTLGLHRTLLNRTRIPFMFELDDLEFCQAIKVMAGDPAVDDVKCLLKRLGHEVLG